VSKKGNRKRKWDRRTKAEPKFQVGLPYYQQIWWDALLDLRSQLKNHCLTAKPGQLRFQDGRLFENLKTRIRAAGKAPVRTMMHCYWLVTKASCRLGYEEPRRLHLEEMNAVQTEFMVSKYECDRFETLKLPVADSLQRRVLLMALESIAWWMEAQESFNTWLAFNHHRAAYRNRNPEARLHALEAAKIARLPDLAREMEIPGKYTVFELSIWLGRKYGQREWVRILEQAARFAEKGQESCTELEQWIWWCYPIFWRYGWSAREVQEAAVARGFSEAGRDEDNFRKCWIDRGLRFRGRKIYRVPPLANLVSHLSPPDATYNPARVPIWSATAYEKKLLGCN
jgi:hypothetical protein